MLILLFGCCFRTDKLHITWIFPTFTTLLLPPAVTAIPNIDTEHGLFQWIAHCFSLSPCRHSLSWICAQQVARYSKFAHSIFIQCHNSLSLDSFQYLETGLWVCRQANNTMLSMDLISKIWIALEPCCGFLRMLRSAWGEKTFFWVVKLPRSSTWCGPYIMYTLEPCWWWSAGPIHTQNKQEQHITRV